jgi:hypothetical protein
MESCTIQLTPAAHKHGNLNIQLCGIDFFPSDVFGGPSRKAGLGAPIILQVDGLSDVIETDIPKDAGGKPRWLFRERAWVKKFVRIHKLKPGDVVTISHIANRTYKVIPGNGVATMPSEVTTLTGKQIHKAVQLHRPRDTKQLDIEHVRTCNCPKNHINCLIPKNWVRDQVAIWELYYEKRDIRDKDIHPAVFPISLPKRCIELFTHRGELVLDPFVGIGTTLIAARDLERNAVGFDLNPKYIDFAKKRPSL